MLRYESLQHTFRHDLSLFLVPFLEGIAHYSLHFVSAFVSRHIAASSACKAYAHWKTPYIRDQIRARYIVDYQIVMGCEAQSVMVAHKRRYSEAVRLSLLMLEPTPRR